MAGWKLVFWEPSLSPHKLALVRALQRHPAVASCRYISQSGLSADRSAQGWQIDDTGDLSLSIAPSSEEITAIVAGGDERTVHIFSGLRNQQVIVDGLCAAVSQRAPFLLLSEPRASDGWRGKLRFVQSWITEGSLRRHASAVLAIGRNGPPWFRATGFPSGKIFPFAYFLPAQPPLCALPADGVVRLAYLGRLVKSKGIGLLLDTLPLLPQSLHIEIAGHGEQASRVDKTVRTSDGRIVHHGPIAMNTVPAFLAGIDILIQPSLTSDDGWAAVVSEALLCGVTAIATAKVGASILLDAPERGRVVARPSQKALAAAILDLINQGDFSPAARAARREWALAHLTGEAGANYLVSILAHLFDGAPRPVPFYDDPTQGPAAAQVGEASR